jgi:predicted transcriptional regulator
MRKAGPAREIPPPLELQCLKALWALREANVRDVQQALGRDLAYTTVMTLLDRLVRKGVVARRKAGRLFLYFPQTPRDAMRRVALKEFLDIYFDGSEKELLAFLREAAAPEPVSAGSGATLDAALL